MEKIIAEFGQVLEKAKTLLRNNEIRSNELSAQAEELSARSAKLKNAEEDFARREFEVQKVEDVASLKIKAESLLEEANKKMDEVRAREAEFKANSEVQIQQINNQRKLAEQEDANNRKRMADIENEIGRRVNAVLVNMGIRKG